MFKKAERKKAKLKISIIGHSGSGKTLSALLIAKGLGSKIAVVDTENGSASLYSDREGVPEFDVLDIKPPFETEKYSAAIKGAVEGGYDVIILDSVSHLWSGTGGLLEQKSMIDRRGGNSYTNWGPVTKKYESFISDILQSDIHIICTVRSKEGVEMQKDERGKSVPVKIGVDPIMRDGFDYEFSLVLEMSASHEASVRKDRTGLFDGKIFKPSEEIGSTLMKWLDSGKEPTKQKEEPTPTISEESALELSELIGKSQEDIEYLNRVLSHYKATKLTEKALSNYAAIERSVKARRPKNEH